MEEYNFTTAKKLFEKFQPVAIKFDAWPFSETTIERIDKRETTGTGLVKYVVLFKDGQKAKIPARSLNESNKEMVEEFELSRFRSNEPGTRKRVTYFQAKNKQKKKIKLTNNRRLDDFVVSDESDVESPAQTRSGRRLVQKEKSYMAEFNADLPSPKLSLYSYPVPQNINQEFIKAHCLNCSKCDRSGNPQGPVDVPIGQYANRVRLLLCKVCSSSRHNDCVSSYDKNFDDETCEYTCSKCIKKGSSCSGCKNKISTKVNSNNTNIALRCNNCSRAYHPKCIKLGISPTIQDVADAADIASLYEKGRCIECDTYKQKSGTIATERTTGDMVEFLIKWKNKSYRHASWVSEAWYVAVNPTSYKAYLKKRESPDYRIMTDIPVEWKTVDRILDVEWEDEDETQVSRILAVFKDTAYDEATWDEPPEEDDTELYPDYETALNRYISLQNIEPPRGMRQLVADVRKSAKAESYERHELKSQPNFMTGGQLMNHQLEGLNWLLYQWEKKQSCVLADDMGLGKTIQIIGYLYVLFKKYNIYPFVIVVPNSTATNWVREFEKWAPDMAAVPLYGAVASRTLALKNEIFDSKGNIKCHAVVATYEAAMDVSELRRVFWPVLVVDESQRLKNDNSLLFRTLKSWNVDQITLLSGTPLQNNLRELFNIMNFIHPDDFTGDDSIDYADMTKEKVEELHRRLRPHFLRRTKEEVLKTLPPKYELIVPLSMSPLQKQVYKECLSKNIYETLSKKTGSKVQKGLQNIFMNLRKTLNHPYLLDGVENPQDTPEETQRAMINACEKLKLFHQMFPKLKAQGHRLLIFTTMTRVLDILEDYFHYEQIKYTRLDGNCNERQRVRCIDAFNAPNSKLDVFLLSTRAGGVGINLATADTVIIWDSDWNPYADLQAISRAHRIGQNNMVLILRFMTRLSVEERILQIGKKKMALEHVVVERMKEFKENDEEKLDDYESILKFGAEALFANDDSKDIHYDSAAIDSLLVREKYREAAIEKQEEEVRNAEEGNAKDPSLNFSFAKVWQVDGSIEDLPSAEDDANKEQGTDDFWTRFLKEKEIEAQKRLKKEQAQIELLGRGARKRNAVTYAETMNLSKLDKQDVAFTPGVVDDSSDDEEEAGFVFTDPLVPKASTDSPNLKRSSKANRPTQQRTASQSSLSHPPPQDIMIAILPEYIESMYVQMQKLSRQYLVTLKTLMAQAFHDNLIGSPNYVQAQNDVYRQLFQALEHYFKAQFRVQYEAARQNGLPPSQCDKIHELQGIHLRQQYERLDRYIHEELSNQHNNLQRMRENIQQQRIISYNQSNGSNSNSPQVESRETSLVLHTEAETEQQKTQLEAQTREQLLKSQEIAARKSKELQEKLLAQYEANHRVQLEVQQRAQLEAQQRAQLEAQQRAQYEAEQRAHYEAQRRAQQQAQQDAHQRAQYEAQQRAQQEALQQAQQQQAQGLYHTVQAVLPQASTSTSAPGPASDVISPHQISHLQAFLSQYTESGQSISHKDFLEHLANFAVNQANTAGPANQIQAQPASTAFIGQPPPLIYSVPPLNQNYASNQPPPQHQQTNLQLRYYPNTSVQNQPPVQYVAPADISRVNTAYFSSVDSKLAKTMFNPPPPRSDLASLDIIERTTSNSPATSHSSLDQNNQGARNKQ